ncbi:MAG TPA: hypothetical protein VIZ68_04125, partial [Thermoplasmata archaeon]
MASDGATPARSSAGGPAPPGRSGVSTSPVAVVWCRQVDNEAESPGYTTVPEEFPGHRETLEVIRTVGNLTINVADTHDYWDPDPAQPLSYYPNLFLYPAYGGRYTCLGRMFLSTEDRPRLGMKTLVLDTAQLLASGEFGSTILRWHASMGGPRREGSRPSPVPDPGLYPIVGEGFLFHRGSTDPVVIVASDDWETTMESILDLIRLLPASLIALGAILAFPYFLPQPKTNLHEFTEQLPLALALMRVPRSEAAGDRHEKRMASWESAPVTLRDLSGGVPTAPKGKENVPLVLQYARDRLDSKLLPISQRVDLVEIARVKGHLADPERQGGQDHRKEMWRIGTAMESAALLLQRARGRHVPVNVETAKRAQEYLQARLPESDPAIGVSAPSEPAVVASASLAGSDTGAVPPWLQRAPEPPKPAPPSAPEVVPVSISDDPSLLPPAPRPLAPTPSKPADAPPPVAASVASAVTYPPPPPPMSSAPPPSRPTVAPAIPPATAPEPPHAHVDAVSLRVQLQQDLLKLLEQRLAAGPRHPGGGGPATALDDKLRTELESRTDARIAAAVQQISNQVAATLRSLEERQGRASDERFATQESRLKETTSVGITAELDRRFQAIVEPRINDLSRQVKESIDRSSTSVREENRADLGRAVEALKLRVDQTEQAMRESLSTQLDLHLREAADRDRQDQVALAANLDSAVQRFSTELDGKRQRDAKELEERLGQFLDGRLRESHEKVTGLALTQDAKAGAVVDQRIAGLE